MLAPGAGADRNHHTLVALEAACGLPCRRMDFPYRKAGKKVPDKAPVAIAAVREEAAQLGQPLVLGGRSFGGRMSSMAVAEGLPAAGLVLLSYPLHPPGKPDQLRTEHFPRIKVPCLFVTGTSDPFGTVEEFERAFKLLSGPVEAVWLQGGHDPAGLDQRIAAAVVAWLEKLK